MAIPGLKANYTVRAKVRIGEKKRSGTKEYPSSVDYFICDDAEITALGDKPKVLRIRFPFAAAVDNFSTGLEFWRGKQLTCYSKGEEKLVSDDGGGQGTDTVAYRVNSMLGDFKVIGEPMGRGKERTPVACPFRTCPNFKSKDCKPMGRLQFFIEGGRTDEVLQFETKSWNTIEGIEATLASAGGDLRGRTFLMTVAMEQKANQRFPVVSLREETVNIETPSDVDKADVLLALRGALEGHGVNPNGLKPALAAALDVTNPGWRENPAYIERIKEVGPLTAAEGLLKRYDA